MTADDLHGKRVRRRDVPGDHFVVKPGTLGTARKVPDGLLCVDWDNGSEFCYVHIDRDLELVDPSEITEIKEVSSRSTIVYTRRRACPICSHLGEDLIFAFYCSNSECRNYHK